MTTLAIKTQSFLQKILNGIIESRQRSANYEVARMLKGEYPGESVDHILHLLETGRIEEIGK